MRAWMAQAAAGGAALVVSAALFVVELVHLLTEPRVPHHHLAPVVTAFLLSMALAGVSIILLLEVRSRRARALRARGGLTRPGRPRSSGA